MHQSIPFSFNKNPTNKHMPCLSSHFLMSSSLPAHQRFLSPCFTLSFEILLLKLLFFHKRGHSRRASKPAISRPPDISIYPPWQTPAELPYPRLPLHRRCWQMIRERCCGTEAAVKGWKEKRASFWKVLSASAVDVSDTASRAALWFSRALGCEYGQLGLQEELPLSERKIKSCAKQRLC